VSRLIFGIVSDIFLERSFIIWGGVVRNDTQIAERDVLRLKRKIQSRKKFLDRILEPVINLIREEGTIIDYQEYTYLNFAELRDFGHFSFHTDPEPIRYMFVQGYTVKIYYHPGRKFREGGLESAFDKDWTPVLDVRVDDYYEVAIFNEQRNWQRALIRILKNSDRIAAQIRKRREKEQMIIEEKCTDNEKIKKLLEEAKKLKVT